jgi:hypothetical protein
MTADPERDEHVALAGAGRSDQADVLAGAHPFRKGEKKHERALPPHPNRDDPDQHPQYIRALGQSPMDRSAHYATGAAGKHERPRDDRACALQRLGLLLDRQWPLRKLVADFTRWASERERRLWPQPTRGSAQDFEEAVLDIRICVGDDEEFLGMSIQVIKAYHDRIVGSR